MKTVADNVKDLGFRLSEGIASLFDYNVRLVDVDSPSSSFVWIGPHYKFADLPLDKKRLQSRLDKDRTHFVEIVRALLRSQPDDVLRKIEEHDSAIREVIEQTTLVWHATADDAVAAVKKSIDELLDAISSLYDAVEGSVVLIPDTNALIYSPAFADWAFDEFPEFEILLVPMLLSELDTLKNEHRNENVREKVQSIIRQIKEYRRRGSLDEGVAIVGSRIRLRSTAVEPKVEEALSWLDSASPDDRILASCVETMRACPRSSVVLVTGDINLQNKAEFARVPFIEPPDAAMTT